MAIWLVHLQDGLYQYGHHLMASSTTIVSTQKQHVGKGSTWVDRTIYIWKAIISSKGGEF